MVASVAVAPAPAAAGISTVGCLRCRETYWKPTTGGTRLRNPGCPACGYLGWAPGSSVEPSAAIRDPRALRLVRDLGDGGRAAASSRSPVDGSANIRPSS